MCQQAKTETIMRNFNVRNHVPVILPTMQFHTEQSQLSVSECRKSEAGAGS